MIYESFQEILKQPIDTRNNNFGKDITITSKTSSFKTPEKINENEIKELWCKRLSKIRKPNRLAKMQIITPKLMNSQENSIKDPLNRLTIEQIHNARSVNREIKINNNKIIPKMRKLPAGLTHNPLRSTFK